MLTSLSLNGFIPPPFAHPSISFVLQTNSLHSFPSFSIFCFDDSVYPWSWNQCDGASKEACLSYPTPPSFHLSARPTVFFSSLAHFWIFLTQEKGSLLFCPASFFSPLPFFFISLSSTYSFPLFIFLPLLFSPTCHAPLYSFVLPSSFSFLFLIPSSSLFFFFFSSSFFSHPSFLLSFILSTFQSPSTFLFSSLPPCSHPSLLLFFHFCVIMSSSFPFEVSIFPLLLSCHFFVLPSSHRFLSNHGHGSPFFLFFSLLFLFLLIFPLSPPFLFFSSLIFIPLLSGFFFHVFFFSFPQNVLPPLLSFSQLLLLLLPLITSSSSSWLFHSSSFPPIFLSVFFSPNFFPPLVSLSSPSPFLLLPPSLPPSVRQILFKKRSCSLMVKTLANRYLHTWQNAGGRQDAGRARQQWIARGSEGGGGEKITSWQQGGPYFHKLRWMDSRGTSVRVSIFSSSTLSSLSFQSITSYLFFYFCFPRVTPFLLPLWPPISHILCLLFITGFVPIVSLYTSYFKPCHGSWFSLWTHHELKTNKQIT